MNLPMLGAMYHQGRNDVWSMTPRDLATYLDDWAAAKAKAAQG